MLDGSMADLGTGMDVLFQGAEEDVISFELRGSDVPPCRLSFDYSRTADNLKSSGSVVLPELLARNAAIRRRAVLRECGPHRPTEILPAI